MIATSNLPHRPKLLAGVVLFITTLLIKPVDAQSANEVWFEQALVAIEQQRWSIAQQILNQALIQDPSLHRARAELAYVYLQDQQPVAAIEHLDHLLQLNSLPENVRQNLLQLKLQAQQQLSIRDSSHQWALNSTWSYGYDSNVRFTNNDYYANLDPTVFCDFEISQDQLLCVNQQGVLFEVRDSIFSRVEHLPDIARQLSFSDHFLEAKFYLDHTYQSSLSPKLSWDNSLGIQLKNNSQLNNYDKLLYSALSRVNYQWSEISQLQIEAEFRHLDQNNQTRNQQSKIIPSYSFYTDLGRWQLGYEWHKKQYQPTELNTEVLSSVSEIGITAQSRVLANLGGNIQYGHIPTIKWSDLLWQNKLFLLAEYNKLKVNSRGGLDYKGYKVKLSTVYQITSTLELSLVFSQQSLDFADNFVLPISPKDISKNYLSKISYQLTDTQRLAFTTEYGKRRSDIYGGFDIDKRVHKLSFEWQL